jgi:xanthine dehydrogenase molybdopterin-binding subunit B
MLNGSFDDIGIHTIDDAIANGSFYEPEHVIKHGDISKGFEQSDRKIKGTVYMGGQEQASISSCTSLTSSIIISVLL